jgi:hypothetical protein
MPRGPAQSASRPPTRPPPPAGDVHASHQWLVALWRTRQTWATVGRTLRATGPLAVAACLQELIGRAGYGHATAIGLILWFDSGITATVLAMGALVVAMRALGRTPIRAALWRYGAAAALLAVGHLLWPLDVLTPAVRAQIPTPIPYLMVVVAPALGGALFLWRTVALRRSDAPGARGARSALVVAGMVVAALRRGIPAPWSSLWLAAAVGLTLLALDSLDALLVAPWRAARSTAGDGADAASDVAPVD